MLYLNVETITFMADGCKSMISIITAKSGGGVVHIYIISVLFKGSGSHITAKLTASTCRGANGI